jgi:hypothetical protein
MSKQLDYNNLSEEDKDWLRARGWGNRIPGEGRTDPTPGVVLDASASGEDILAQVENTGTATRPATFNVGPADEYTEEDYRSWKVDDLKAEVAERNAARDNEDDHVKPESDKKAHLVSALVADDEAHAGSDTQE